MGVTAAVPVVAVAVGFARSKFTRSWSARPDGSALALSLAALGEWDLAALWAALAAGLALTVFGPSAMRCALGAVGGSACWSWRRTASAR